MIEYAGIISLILICGLFADNMVSKQKIKDLAERLKDIEKSMRPK